MYNNQLICYYSDSRDFVAHSQKLVHQRTSDLINWGPIVDDEANPNRSERPGMTTVSRMGNGQYFMTYENIGTQVYFKIAADPTKFAASVGQPLKDTNGRIPTSSPVNVWTRIGSNQGTLVVSANSDSDLLLNRNYGVGPWTRLSSQGGSAYSRGLQVGFNPKDILIINAGRLNGGATNKVTSSARDVNGCGSC